MMPRRSAPALACLALAGCSLMKPAAPKDPAKDPEVQPAAALAPAAEATAGARVLGPRRCELTLAIPSRPIDDPLLTTAIWALADDQAISAEARRPLEANGIRVGLIVGPLPADVESLFQPSTPNHVEPSRISLPDGDHTSVTLGPPASQASLLLSRGASASGKEYADAAASFRLTASHDGDSAVMLRFVPEIHHGPVRHDFAAAPNANPFSPQQFVVKDGQQEEVLNDLAATIKVQPGQVVVLGSRSDSDRSLGSFLFTQAEPNSDRMVRRVLLVWAVQANGDAFGRPAPGPGLFGGPGPAAAPRELPALKPMPTLSAPPAK